MAKVKQRKSESWKPGLLQDDGFISKNKKRKEKRMSLNLSAKKIDTDEFIPVKKSSLLPFNKTKKDNDSKQTPSKLLSTSLQTQSKKQTPKRKDTPLAGLKVKSEPFSPLKVKQDSTPKRKFSVGVVEKNTPKINGTPKPKNDSVLKSSLKRKAQEYIDSEAEEGEEPITDKEVKPYVKGQKKKSITFKFDNDQEDGSDDDSDGSDDNEVNSALEFLDDEASEGEETDDDEDDDDEDDSGDDDEDDEEDDDLSNFLVADGEGSDDEDGSEEEDDSESEEEAPKPQIKNKQAKKESNLKEKQTKPVKAEKVKEPVIKSKSEVKQESKKSKANDKATQKTNKKEQPKEEEAKDETPMVTTDFAAYIKFLPKTVTEDQVREALSNVVGSENLISLRLKQNNRKRNTNNALIYLSNQDCVTKLENKSFTADKVNFKVYKARESKKVIKDKPVAFLPRVPTSIDDEVIKSAVEKHIGAGKVVKVTSKNILSKYNTRHVLVELCDAEALKSVIYKGSYTLGETEVSIRQAFESGYKIPTYRVVLSEVPENTTEAVITKLIESKVGKGTIINVKFSASNRSYVFVTLNTEEAQKKLLQPDVTLSIKGTPLKLYKFEPRNPKKRGLNKKNKKAKKQKLNEDAATDKKTKQPKASDQNSAKKPLQPNNSDSPKKQKPKQQTNNAQNSKKKQNPKQNASQGSPKKPEQQNAQNFAKKQKQNQNVSPQNGKNKKAKKAQNQVPDKKLNLSNKLEEKKQKLKNKKLKKQANADD